MPTFAYSATLPSGEYTRGRRKAASQEAAELALYELELRNIRVVEAPSVLKTELTAPTVKRVEVMHLTCAAGLDAGALACSVYDGTRTRFFRLAADTGAVNGFGWLDGRFTGNGDVVDGWRTGWIGSTAVAIDLLNGRVVRVPRSEGAVGQLAVSGSRLAAIVFDRGSSHLRIYEIDPPDGGDGRRAILATKNRRDQS